MTSVYILRPVLRMSMQSLEYYSINEMKCTVVMRKSPTRVQSRTPVVACWENTIPVINVYSSYFVVQIYRDCIYTYFWDAIRKRSSWYILALTIQTFNVPRVERVTREATKMMNELWWLLHRTELSKARRKEGIWTQCCHPRYKLGWLNIKSYK